MISIDIGCGYDNKDHSPSGADVNLDLNLGKDPAFLYFIDNPVIASAEDLPFRLGIAYKLYLKAILEHLPYPFKALVDAHNVLRPGGVAEIELPIISSHGRGFLRILFFEFPFSILPVYRNLKHYRDNLKVKGMAHIRDVKPGHVLSLFRCGQIEVFYGRHKWFMWFWGRWIRRLLNNREPIRGHQGVYRMVLKK